MKKIILIILVLAAVVGGCKKYEEGPCISLRSAENRIMGQYELVELSTNGVDELDLYSDSLEKQFYFFLHDDHWKICHVANNAINWLWRLYEDERFLKVETSGAYSPEKSWGPFKDNVKPLWEILRLTNRELKMKTTYNDKEYVIVLKKK